MITNRPIQITGFLLFLLMPLLSSAQTRTVISTTSPGVTRLVEIYEYDCVDEQPTFPGGNIALMRFINNERHYPAEAYRNGIQGRVLCGFIVHENGRISDITVVKSVEESLDQEAVRIIASMPPWVAGSLHNHPVPVYCFLAIPFRR